MRGATWIYLFGVCLMFVWSRQQHRALLLWIASATPPPKSRRSLAEVLRKFCGNMIGTYPSGSY
jgi:hypothetical protein